MNVSTASPAVTAPKSATPIVRVSQVRKTYGTGEQAVTVLDGLDLDIHSSQSRPGPSHVASRHDDFGAG